MPTSWSPRPPSTSTATVTCWPVRCCPPTAIPSGSGSAPGGATPVPCWARSRRGCCNGACGRCFCGLGVPPVAPWRSPATSRGTRRGGFGGMLSIRLVGGAEQAMAVLGAVRVFKRATSLGGVESLIEHRRSQEGPSSPVPDDLLRLSIGIEAPEDLLADLDAALDATRARRPAAAPQRQALG